MDYDLLIRKSYHGNGGRDGYRYKLYNKKGKKLGELKNIPVDCRVGHTISIGGTFYVISHIYDSKKPREANSEVVYYELLSYTFKPDFELVLKNKTKEYLYGTDKSSAKNGKVRQRRPSSR